MSYSLGQTVWFTQEERDFMGDQGFDSSLPATIVLAFMDMMGPCYGVLVYGQEKFEIKDHRNTHLTWITRYVYENHITDTPKEVNSNG